MDRVISHVLRALRCVRDVGVAGSNPVTPTTSTGGPNQRREVDSIRRPKRPRNVQKQSRGSSSCFAVIVAEHSAESLTPFDSGVRFANGAERPQEVVFFLALDDYVRHDSGSYTA
jgi:hypothetical protein